MVKRRSALPGYTPPGKLMKTLMVKVDPFAADPAYMPELNGKDIQGLTAGQVLSHDMPGVQDTSWR
jgi:hypothetical protein